VQSVVAFCRGGKRIVTVAVNGVENQVDVEERDFLINVETGRDRARRGGDDALARHDRVLRAGIGVGRPASAAAPGDSVAVANILLDPTQVVSITMIEANQVASTEELDERAKLLEAFKLRSSRACPRWPLTSRAGQPDRSVGPAARSLAHLRRPGPGEGARSDSSRRQ